MSPMGQGRARNQALDAIKGFLVIIMILYHAASVTHGTGGMAFESVVYRYLSFIHTAFIGLSGFLVGWHYLPMMSGSPRRTRMRLFVRSLKLLAILIGSNLALYSLGIKSARALSQAIHGFDDILANFVLSLNGGLVAFEILYPIALVLLIGSLCIGRVSGASLLAACLVLDVFFHSSLLIGVAAGLIGLWIGEEAHGGRAERVIMALQRCGLTCSLALLAAYMFFIKGIEIGNYHLRYGFLVVETVLWFLVAVRTYQVIQGRAVSMILTRFGMYTLAAYMFQMLFLKINMHVLTRTATSGLTAYSINVMLTGLELYLFIGMVETLRTRYEAVDRSYRMIFL